MLRDVICKTAFTRYNRLSNRLYNLFDNRLYRVNKHPTGCQTGCQTGLTTGVTAVLNEQHCSFNQLSNRLYNPVWYQIWASGNSFQTTSWNVSSQEWQQTGTSDSEELWKKDGSSRSSNYFAGYHFANCDTKTNALMSMWGAQRWLHRLYRRVLGIIFTGYKFKDMNHFSHKRWLHRSMACFILYDRWSS